MLGALDFDAALEIGAVFDADARRRDVAGDRAVLLDLDAVAGVKIARQVAVDDHFASPNFRAQLAGAADREALAIEDDRAFQFAVDLKILFAGDLALNFNARAERRDSARCRGAGAC